ncbi:nudix hydrolase 9 isoform X4 [Nicotiana tabacum]|uniref:Nudix hydrolase 9 isoform X4 n=3 Tax=Nicotiana TaxID=4085 RepID=A0A1S4DMZ8_TOBAC|nr:PREDICTED: nudix hydrolase 9-like isoform X4 [Nicotiana tabacum]
MEEKISCDGGHEFKLLLSCPSGLSPSQLFSMKHTTGFPIPILLWSSPFPRYGTQEFNKVHHFTMERSLGTFVGTNLSPIWERYLVQSEDDCIQCQHTSSPLGNGALVETSDKKILVLQRSNKVGEFPGYFVFPGGHPEPQEVGIISHDGFKELNQCRPINSKVSQEMFDSIVREVVEEIGAPADSLSSPIFIGISRRVLNVRPTAFFFIKCNLQSDEIQQLYSSAEDGFESTQLYAVSMSDLENMASKMPGCHRGGFALYKLMEQDANNS